MGQRQKPETEAKGYLTSHNKTQRQGLSHVHTLVHIAHGAGQYSFSKTHTPPPFLDILTKVTTITRGKSLPH